MARSWLGAEWTVLSIQGYGRLARKELRIQGLACRDSNPCVRRACARDQTRVVERSGKRLEGIDVLYCVPHADLVYVGGCIFVPDCKGRGKGCLRLRLTSVASPGVPVRIGRKYCMKFVRIFQSCIYINTLHTLRVNQLTTCHDCSAQTRAGGRCPPPFQSLR